MGDTSALIAFFVKSELHHGAIKQFTAVSPALQWLILSTVFDETVTWMRIKVSPEASVSVGKVLRREHQYIALSAADDAATWEAFCRYSDKRWSYTDCSILAMAQRLAVPGVVSFDAHFRQMAGLGIICLPD